MKSSVQLIALVLFPVFLTPSLAEDVFVEWNGEGEEGLLAAELYDSAAAFDDFNAPAYRTVQRLSPGDRLVFSNVSPGAYALMVYRDENENGRLDRNFLGIPKEPIGFANGYRPKGPPSHKRALFDVAPGSKALQQVSLEKPLGEFGRLGVGAAFLAKSSPYRGSDEESSRLLPALTYMGERLRILGPSAQFDLWGNRDISFAASASYRLAAYEENDSPVLSGLGDREDTVMAGFDLKVELPENIDLELGYQHDVLDRIGGGIARLSAEKSFPVGIVRISPELAVNWLSGSVVRHEFGVPASAASPDRPAYRPGGAFSLEPGLGLFIELTESWLAIVNVSVELLDGEVTDSPLVDTDYLVNGFGALSYAF